jgi:hypothetical protein
MALSEFLMHPIRFAYGVCLPIFITIREKHKKA